MDMANGICEVLEDVQSPLDISHLQYLFSGLCSDPSEYKFLHLFLEQQKTGYTQILILLLGQSFSIRLQWYWKLRGLNPWAHTLHADRWVKLALDICCLFAPAASCAVRATWLQTTWKIGWVSQWALSQLSIFQSNCLMRGQIGPFKGLLPHLTLLSCRD